jgi:hypothetical protein
VEKADRTIPGNGLFAGVVRVSHDGNSAGFWRVFAKTFPLVFNKASFFFQPLAHMRGAALDGDHTRVGGERVGCVLAAYLVALAYFV